MKPLNCVVVALWVWAISRFRAALWTRRSTSFLGLVPHMGTAHRVGFRDFVTLEYTPVKSELGTWRNLLIFFRGRYRVNRWRCIEGKQFHTLAEAQQWIDALKTGRTRRTR